MIARPGGKRAWLGRDGGSGFPLMLLSFWGLATSVLTAASLDFPVRHLSATPKRDEKSIDFSFPYTNRGAAPITIIDIKTGCGCTVASVAKKTIAPGETGLVPVTYTIGNVYGRQKNTVRIFTDDPADPVIALAFEVVLPEGPVISPKILYWEQMGALSTQTVTVTLPIDSPMTITRAFDEREKFKVQLLTTDDPKRVAIAVTPLQLDRERLSVITLESSTGLAFKVFVQVRSKPKKEVASP